MLKNIGPYNDLIVYEDIENAESALCGDCKKIRESVDPRAISSIIHKL